MKKTIVLIFIGFLCTVMISTALMPDETISEDERRHLEEFPVLSLETFFSGEFMEDLESYFLDHFVLRDKLRDLKAKTESFIFSKKDVNGFFMDNQHIFQLNFDYKNEDGIRFKTYVEELINKLDLNNVYLSIIPDKNYYGPSDYPTYDYEQMIEDIESDAYSYINIFDSLNLNSYYHTDPHWKAEKLQGVINKLSNKMGFDTLLIKDYQVKTFQNFIGAYGAQSSFGAEGEPLIILEHDLFKYVKVFNYETNEGIPVYNPGKFSGIDPYDIFLGGPSALLEITNDSAKTDKELILFRDSFGSSIAPLLVDAYKKITIVDTRYITSEYLTQFITYTNQDVLFLYSTMIVDNPMVLR